MAQARQNEQQENVRVIKKQVTRFLSEHGFRGDVNTSKRRLFKSEYPLHVAVRKQDADMVRLLLLAGADRSLANSSGVTPVQKALKYRLLLSNDNRPAVTSNSIKVLRELGGDLPETRVREDLIGKRSKQRSSGAASNDHSVVRDSGTRRAHFCGPMVTTDGDTDDEHWSV